MHDDRCVSVAAFAGFRKRQPSGLALFCTPCPSPIGHRTSDGGSNDAFSVERIDRVRPRQQSGGVVAKIILRDAQHLASVEAIGDSLVLTMMRFSDELADLGEYNFPHKGDIRPAELKWRAS